MIYIITPTFKKRYLFIQISKKKCKYYIKIDKDNLLKISNKNDEIRYTEINNHVKHEDLDFNINNEAKSEYEINELAKKLINNNLNQDLEFHVNNLHINKIKWKKSKIRNMLFKLRELKFPKDEIFLNAINEIKIKPSDNEKEEEQFCLFTGEFINFNKNKRIEKYIVFMSVFFHKLKNYLLMEHLKQLLKTGTNY